MGCTAKIAELIERRYKMIKAAASIIVRTSGCAMDGTSLNAGIAGALAEFRGYGRSCESRIGSCEAVFTVRKCGLDRATLFHSAWRSGVVSGPTGGRFARVGNELHHQTRLSM